MERLDKLLAATGRWSRREVKDLVRQGRVELDGQPAAAADVKIDPAAADIRVDGEALSYSRFTYLMLHKPAGVLSAARDSRQKTVLDLLPPELRRRGLSPVGRTVCAMACVALNSAKAYYEEKHDKGSFIKNIISDNILISDIYMRAKELHVPVEVNRGVFVIRPIDERMESVPMDVVQGLFPDRQNDFVLSVGEADVALIHQLPDGADGRDLDRVAQQIGEALKVDGENTVFVGVGTIATHLRDLAKSYKEAQIAIEVGKVFDTERYIVNYENLGIGRLIYQLPTTLCEMFLQEVFKKNPIDALDQETLFTIYKFFENNLNVSETARKLFVHRNTLVYRLEKIKKLTGLDLREFDDAITFKVALMVKKYLTSRGIEA